MHIFTEAIVRNIVGTLILLIMVSFLFWVGYVNAAYLIPLKNMDMITAIGLRKMSYDYNTDKIGTEIAPSEYNPIPNKYLAIAWDGFTLLGERMGLQWQLAQTGTTDLEHRFPTAYFLQQQGGITFVDAVWKYSGVVCARVMIGGREVWIPLVR